MDGWTIQAVPGKGRGIVATANILRGTLIIAEDSLLKFSADILAFPNCALILEQLQSNLGQHDRGLVNSLHNAYPDLNRLEGIVKSNSLPCGDRPEKRGIFPICSFFNHSCLSNAQFSWSKAMQRGRVYALHNIPQGQEISISYIPDHIWHSTRDERLAWIYQTYNFGCLCQVCTGDPVSVIDSNQRRTFLQQIYCDIGSQIGMLKEGNLVYHNPARALAQLHHVLQLLYTEGDPRDNKTRTAFYNAFQICVGHGDVARATAFMRLAVRITKDWKGSDSDGFAAWEGLVAGPWRHAIANKTAWWKTRQEDAKAETAPDFNEWLWARERERPK